MEKTKDIKPSLPFLASSVNKLQVMNSLNHKNVK